ncbi:MAG: IPT/TIG domain-containing protein [bacterium]
MKRSVLYVAVVLAVGILILVGCKVRNPSILINDGAETTDSLEVTLTLSAEDAVKMMISNYEDFHDAKWEPFVPTKPWTLELMPGAGNVATVYAVFRALRGKPSEVVSDSIIVVSGPTLDHFTVEAPGEVDVNTSFSITITAKDAGGNTLTSYAGTVALGASSGNISPTEATDFVDGVKTLDVILDTVGDIVITATDKDGGKTGSSEEIKVKSAPPAIGELNPNWGIPGKEITIKGERFGVIQGGSTVTFNGISASIKEGGWSNTEIVAIVPDGLTLNSFVDVVVTVGGEESDSESFYVGWKVSTLAGDVDNPVSGYQDGSGKVARFNSPKGVVVVENKLYVVDSGNKAIRSVNTSVDPAEVGTLVQDNTLLASPTGIALYGDYLYVTDGNAIRRVEISSGSIDTLPVSGVVLNNPRGITAKDGYLYVANTDGNNILKISVSDGAGENLVTLGAPSPYGITTDGVDLYVTRSSATEHRLDRITMSGGVTSIVTSGLEYPRDLVVGDGEIYVADTMNFVIRRVDVGVVETIGGGFDILGSADGFGVNARFNRPQGIAFGSGVLYVADTYNHIIRKMEP